MLRHLFLSGALAVAIAVSAGTAHGQIILPPSFPGGPTTIINPDRINNPLSNVPIGGTTSSFGYWVPGLGWVGGTSYIGLDGKPHGTTVMPGGPGGGTIIHHYAKRTGTAGRATPVRPNTVRTYRR